MQVPVLLESSGKAAHARKVFPWCRKKVPDFLPQILSREGVPVLHPVPVSFELRFTVALWLKRQMKRPAKKGAEGKRPSGKSGEPLCPECRQVWGDKLQVLSGFVWRLPRQETGSYPATLEEAFCVSRISVSFSFPLASLSDPLFLVG